MNAGVTTPECLRLYLLLTRERIRHCRQLSGIRVLDEHRRLLEEREQRLVQQLEEAARGC